MLEDTYDQAGRKLKSARDELSRAQRDMGRAEQQRRGRRAPRRGVAPGGRAVGGDERAQRRLEGDAGQRARDLAAAEAANAKARLLQPTRPEQDDPNIAAAMADASGAGPRPTTMSDRLAALRQRQNKGVQA